MSGTGADLVIGVVGSCNVDLSVRCAELPRPGETVLGADVERLPGGKGANQAAALARLGVNVALIASVGDDDAGEWLLGQLEGRGVDLSHVQRSSRATGTAFITVDRHGENEIVVAPGANAALNLGSLDLGAFDVVLAQMEVDPSVIDAAARASRAFILNAAPAAPVDSATLARCAVVIANELEVQNLELAEIDHCVLTLGARGAVHYQRGREVARATPRALEPVDTVGAGDVFCAAYALQFASGANASDALQFAVAAGSLATLGKGAQGALPTKAEVEQWLERE